MLIIDAGHGGCDGGAVSISGQTESEINLAIALKAQALCRLFGMEPLMTRTTNALDYPQQLGSIREKKIWDQKTRAAMINETPDAILLSIHQNKYPDPRPNGVQVLYGAAEGSADFAEITHGNLTQFLCPDNRRVAAPISEKIFLLRSIHCPAILAECGFLSNAAEAEKLAAEPYQRGVATILIASYLQFIS